MAVDWRALLTSINVEFRDRGPNTSNGNININCAFCAGADPSFHLAINENSGQYYCFRSGRSHSGSSPDRLLIALGVDRIDAFRMLRDFDTAPDIKREETRRNDIDTQWRNFRPVRDSYKPMEYLYYKRGFPAYDLTYDLRYTEYGDFKYRVLFPLRYELAGEVVGWTGRSIYDKTPIYKMEHGGQDGHIYIPGPLLPVVVITEGPIDALKTTIAGLQHGVSAIALLGLDFGPSRMVRLQKALMDATTIVVCLDRTVSQTVSRTLIKELQASLLPIRASRPNIARVAPAGTQKDNGAASIGELDLWARKLLTL